MIDNNKKRVVSLSFDTFQKDLFTHLVYSVTFSEELDQYIEQTKRKMITRVREHQKSCEDDLSGIQLDINNKNGIPFHYATTGHHFPFQDTIILERE